MKRISGHLAAMIALVIVSFGAIGFKYVGWMGDAVSNNGFIDTDDFTRAVRILNLLTSGNWYDSVMPQVMGGLQSHWTRTSDLAVLIWAAPLHWAGLDARDAVLYASYVSPVAILVLFAVTWAWAVRPLAERGSLQSLLVTIVPILTLQAASWFAPMRIDHHGLIVTWAVLLAGMAFRMAVGQHGRWLPWLAGIACGLAIWVGIEDLLYVGCLFGVIGLTWAVRGGRDLARIISSLREWPRYPASPPSLPSAALWSSSPRP